MERLINISRIRKVNQPGGISLNDIDNAPDILTEGPDFNDPPKPCRSNEVYQL